MGDPKSVLAIITPLGGGGLADYIPHPDQGLPKPQPGTPDQGLPPPTDGSEPHPEHPIFFPPEVQPPIVVEPPVEPENPIVIPPDGGDPVPPDITERFDVKVGWTAETGWFVVFVPTGPIPTPSA